MRQRDTIRRLLATPFQMPTVAQIASAHVRAVQGRQYDEAEVCLAALNFRQAAVHMATKARARRRGRAR